ncbi:MAG: hypothetical protein SFU98_19320 [Leptospiraceae bacterium]|nr:hypothetical protein [Leptospiraceae bacterium]
MRILSIFNFSLILFTFNCSAWYRELPQTTTQNITVITGKWIRKNPPKSPINSVVYKNSSMDTIEFQENKFLKKYDSMNEISGILNTIHIQANGVFQQKGNWVLLEFLEVSKKIVEDGKVSQTKMSNPNKLLYYFSEKEKLLIPMVYEKGLEESEFGVKDLIEEPYKENNKLELSILNFSKKEYANHAYYLESGRL